MQRLKLIAFCTFKFLTHSFGQTSEKIKPCNCLKTIQLYSEVVVN